MYIYYSVRETELLHVALNLMSTLSIFVNTLSVTEYDSPINIAYTIFSITLFTFTFLLSLHLFSVFFLLHFLPLFRFLFLLFLYIALHPLTDSIINIFILFINIRAHISWQSTHFCCCVEYVSVRLLCESPLFWCINFFFPRWLRVMKPGSQRQLGIHDTRET